MSEKVPMIPSMRSCPPTAAKLRETKIGLLKASPRPTKANPFALNIARGWVDKTQFSADNPKTQGFFKSNKTQPTLRIIFILYGNWPSGPPTSRITMEPATRQAIKYLGIDMTAADKLDRRIGAWHTSQLTYGRYYFGYRADYELMWSFDPETMTTDAIIMCTPSLQNSNTINPVNIIGDAVLGQVGIYNPMCLGYIVLSSLVPSIESMVRQRMSYSRHIDMATGPGFWDTTDETMASLGGAAMASKGI
jgi:hypothetical protein